MIDLREVRFVAKFQRDMKAYVVRLKEHKNPLVLPRRIAATVKAKLRARHGFLGSDHGDCGLHQSRGALRHPEAEELQDEVRLLLHGRKNRAYKIDDRMEDTNEWERHR